MKKINIKGKDYIEVNERLKEFHNLYPNGSIETELIEMTDRFITKTNVVPDVKNCETSSVGRALGMLGIGIDTSVASYDEVANAIEQQESPSAPKINLKDQEVANPLFEEAKKKFDGKALESDEWDGSEIIKFGKYRDVAWNKIIDANWIKWVATSSKVDWQRELAAQECERRKINV